MCAAWSDSAFATPRVSPLFQLLLISGRSGCRNRPRGALPGVFGVDPEGGDRQLVVVGLGEASHEGAVELVRHRRTHRHAALHCHAGCHLGVSTVLVGAQLELLERLDDLPDVTGLRGLGDGAEQPAQVRIGVQIQHRDLDAGGPDLVRVVVGCQELLHHDGQLDSGGGLLGLGQPEAATVSGAHPDERLVGTGIEDGHTTPEVERGVLDVLVRPVVAVDRGDRSLGGPLDQHVEDRHDADPVEGLELRVEAAGTQEVVEPDVAVRGQRLQIGELADLFPVGVVPGEERLLVAVESVPRRFAVVDPGQLVAQGVERVTDGHEVERLGRHPASSCS